LTGKKCRGACEQKESAEEYNSRVYECIHHLEIELPSFALVEDGLEEREQSCVLIEKGKFYGMGYLPADTTIYQLDELKNHLTPYPENDYIRGMIFQYAQRFPYKKVALQEQFI
jgi:DNA polymerase-3 subunit epsilon